MTRTMTTDWRSFRILAITLIATCVGLPVAFGQDEPDRVWIYRKRVLEGESLRSTAEAYFTPLFFFPESATNRISVNASKPFPDPQTDEEAEDTCVEFFFGLAGGDDFVGAGFIPGDKLGDKPAFDLTKYLAVGFGRQVQLTFRARTNARETVRVRFEACGLSVGDLEDGIRLPQVPSPQITVLTEEWKTISIDLSKKATGLSSLVCPLKVIAKSNENPGRDEVTVLVDDVRFEVVAPSKKTK